MRKVPHQDPGPCATAPGWLKAQISQEGPGPQCKPRSKAGDTQTHPVPQNHQVVSLGLPVLGFVLPGPLWGYPTSGHHCAHLCPWEEGQHKDLLAQDLQTGCPFLCSPTPATLPTPPTAAREAPVPRDSRGHCWAGCPGNKAPFSRAAGSRGAGCQCQHCPLPAWHCQPGT